MTTKGLIEVQGHMFHIEYDAYPKHIAPLLKKVVKLAKEKVRLRKITLREAILYIVAREFRPITETEIDRIDFDYYWKITQVGSIKLIEGGPSYKWGDSPKEVNKFRAELRKLGVKY